MPKLLTLYKFALLFTIYFVLSTPPVLASTDPQAATVSATATIPTSTPTTGDTTAPPAVILVAPLDDTLTTQVRPEFTWVQTFDTNSNLVYYLVYLDGSATFLGISNTGNSQQNNYVAHLGDGRVYLTPTFDLPEGRHSWSVAAYDGSGNISYSTTWYFTIDTTPPHLTLTNIDGVYPYPSLVEGSNFDLPGPQLVTLTYQTEAWATVSLTLTYQDGSVKAYSYPTNQTGLASFDLDLPLGLYQIVSTSFDHVGLTTTLPLYNLTLSLTPYGGLNPTFRLTLPSNLPYPVALIRTFPATIMELNYSVNIAIYMYVLLAVLILVLLILIWNHQPNILILDSHTHKPFRSVVVYHSRPTHSVHFRFAPRRLYITTHDPILYELSARGTTYIRTLSRYSSLTVRTPDGLTHILSLSVQKRKYIIEL